MNPNNEDRLKEMEENIKDAVDRIKHLENSVFYHFGDELISKWKEIGKEVSENKNQFIDLTNRIEKLESSMNYIHEKFYKLVMIRVEEHEKGVTCEQK